MPFLLADARYYVTVHLMAAKPKALPPYRFPGSTPTDDMKRRGDKLRLSKLPTNKKGK